MNVAQCCPKRNSALAPFGARLQHSQKQTDSQIAPLRSLLLIRYQNQSVNPLEDLCWWSSSGLQQEFHSLQCAMSLLLDQWRSTCRIPLPPEHADSHRCALSLENSYCWTSDGFPAEFHSLYQTAVWCYSSQALSLEPSYY